MSVAGNSNEDYVCDGSDVVSLGIICHPEDINGDNFEFKPTFCHQIFGDQETIYGYKDLRIKILFSAGLLNPYLSIKFSDKINAKGFASPDDIEKILHEKLGITFGRNLDDFIKNLADEPKFKPIGILKSTFKLTSSSCESTRTFVIHYGDISTKGLVPYHEKLETFCLWFIDAANAIDMDDDRWRFFYVFEKFAGTNNEDQYGIVGFATVYEYYAYHSKDTKVRPRISQMLVLPPFQKKGIGFALLQAIYRHYLNDEKVKDITVESPSVEMQSLRDFVDCKNVLGRPEMQNVSVLTREIVQNAAEKVNINNKQSRRIYEILRLLRLKSREGKEYDKYRLEIKSRLNSAHKLEMMQLKGLEKASPKLAAEIKSSTMPNEEKRISDLETAFKNLEKQYDAVINRLREEFPSEFPDTWHRL